MRSSLTCTRRRRFRASETRSRNWWSNAAERKKARPSPDPANKSSATSSKEIHVLKEMMSQETRSRIFFFFIRLGYQMFRTWNNEFTPLGCWNNWHGFFLIFLKIYLKGRSKLQTPHSATHYLIYLFEEIEKLLAPPFSHPNFILLYGGKASSPRPPLIWEA